MKRSLFFGLLGLILSSQSLLGQSVLSTRGLGFLLDPLDARVKAVGGVGIAMFGGSIIPTDPAAAAEMVLPSVQVTYQPQWVTGELDGNSLNSQGTRFPLVALAYPVAARRGTIFFTFGGFLDQRWEITQPGTTEVGQSVLGHTDTFTSSGGVSTVRLGWAQRLGGDLAVAVSVGAHTGSVRRTFTRTLDTLDVGLGSVPFVEDGAWRYGGISGSIGFRWDPLEFLRLGGSLDWSSDLDANPVGDTEAGGLTYPLPTEFRLGASALLTPQLALTLGVSTADWQALEGGVEGTAEAGAVWSLGGGLEWMGPSIGSRNLPIRLGARRTGLPFSFKGESGAEKVFAGGIGLNLNATQGFGLGGIDLGLERGSRDVGTLSESFWRLTGTLKVATW